MKIIKSVILSLFLFIIFTLPVNAKVTENYVKTSDNVNIAYDLYQTGHKDVLVIAHGWFMTKDSTAFSSMARDFSKYYDVIVLDFRGHSKSSGKYTFGAKEINDLIPIIDYAQKHYDKVYLIGFSLGSLIAVDYCSKFKGIDKLILVSAPTDFNRIENHVWNANAFVPTLKKFEYDRWTSIRFSNINQPKIIPVNEIKRVKIPTFFIAGEKDPIIYPWHNELMYKASKCNCKKELLIKKGKHAEDLYLYQPKYFISVCVNWLKKN